jgi:peptidoglycan-N-acetylglucosamine deacetylase
MAPIPEWTPKILDVLKDNNVKATFFLIGAQAEKYPGIAKRIFNEGHEIGNHTFTHPDVSNISKRYFEVELNLTERCSRASWELSRYSSGHRMPSMKRPTRPTR